MTTLHFVVPEGIDDAARPSGGNVYDRRLAEGLGSIGWSVQEHHVAGSWPHQDASGLAALGDMVGRIPGGALVLLDGLIASAAPDVLVPHARRLRLVVLVHMPLGDRPADDDARPREGAVLAAAAAVVTTSAWARRRLLELYALSAARVRVAEPAADAAELAGGSAGGEALLCVAAVSRDKGHDVLLDALATIAELDWSCTCVGPLDRDPPPVRALDGRVRFPGPRTGNALARSYAAADLLVLPSRAETYGMVVIEALARAIPVVASDVGGVGEALGQSPDGTRPGLLVPPGDPEALGAALRAWLTDAELRARLRRGARERRERLPRWHATAEKVAAVLAGVSR